jgi:hypothetical protein
MLACVSTLTDVVSYKDVRHNKEWLTTNEAFCYMRDNCPALFCMLQSRNTSDYITMYNWANGVSATRPNLVIERVKDNGRRDVIFWSVENLKAEEKIWAERLGDSVDGKIYHAPYLNIFFTVAVLKYAQHLEKISEGPRGSFYDPEWFN